MENFVLYDEIGTGDKRMVYKGRRKGSVSYVAIHCVEKEYRNKIQNHVRICYELDHVNIVQFYEWYETTNHLWLVVELCAGGSLQNILELDSYLPEKEIRNFAKDVVKGLAYLHSQDIIYGDLCSANILLDSSGTLKFSNFCSAKFSDASEENEQDDDVTQPQSYFKSPEELAGGEQSKESDLWALGCVLYEMFTGTEPFRGSTRSQIEQKIQHENIPYPMQGQEGTFIKASEDLYMLIQGLLQKDPSQRIDLLELCMHPFWQGELASLADTFDTRESLVSYTSTSMATSVMGEENTTSRDVGRQSSASEADVITLRDSICANDNKKLQSQSLNILANEEREEREALNSSTRSLVTTNNANISKKQAWGGTYKLERGSAVHNLADVVEDQQQSRKHSAKSTSSVKSQKSSVASEKSSASSEKPEKQTRQASAKPPQPPGSERNSITKSSSAAARAAVGQLKSQTSYSLQDSMEPSSTSTILSRDQSDIIPYLGGPDVNVLDHLYHPSDLTVSPIAENRLFDKFPTLKWDQNVINTSIYTSEQLAIMSLDDIRSHLKDLTGVFSAPMNQSNEKVRLRQKMNIVAYLITAVRVEEAANSFLKDDLVKCFLNDLKVVSNQDLKMRIARLLSVVASNATSIDPQFKMGDVFTVVSNQLKQNFRNTRLRHAFLPVIGEFLFYAATQEENEARLISSWEPPGAVFTIITRCLHLLDGEEVTRLMAAKIIENITSTTGRYCKKLVNNDVGLGLWNLYIHSSMDNVKETAASALCRLCMHSTVVIQHVSDRAGFDQFVSGATLGSLKTQQSFVTILVSLLSSANHLKRILGDRQLLTKLVRNLEGHSLILKGKIYLLLAEMCMRSHPTLLTCCQQKLMIYVERDSKRALNSSGRDNSGLTEYLHQCLAIVVSNVLKIVPRIQEDIIHILDTISGRHHPNPAQVKQLKSLLPLFDIFMHLITSSVFRKRMGDNFIASIGIFMKRVQKIHTGEINLSNPSVRNLGESLTNTMFSMVEAIAQHPHMLLHGHRVFINEVLPELSEFFDESDGNIKILCLKLFTEVSAFYLESEENEGLGTSADQRTLSKINLLKVINKGFIPRFGNLLQDQIPFPSYSVKLMRACVEKSHDMAKTLLQDTVVLSMLFSILKDNRTEIYDSVLQSTVGIFSNLVPCKELKLALLCEQDFLGDVASLVETANSYLGNHSYEMSHLLLQLLDILNHILKKVEEPVKRVLSSKGARKPGSPSANDTEQLLQETKHLSKLDGLLMNLSIANDCDIQEWACRCLYLSAELYGGSQDECNLTIDHIESLLSAVKSSGVISRKRQKLLMRILKRFLQTNEFCQQYALESPALKDLFEGLLSSTKEGTDQDSKSVRQMATDLLGKWTKH